MIQNILLKNLKPGTQVIFKNLLEENANDICHGEVLEDGFIACHCGCKGSFEPEDAEIIEVLDTDAAGCKMTLWVQQYTVAFNQIETFPIEVCYHHGAYHAITPEFPCAFPGDKEAYALPQDALNRIFGDGNPCYYSLLPDKEAFYQALLAYYQSRIRDSQLKAEYYGNLLEKVGALARVCKTDVYLMELWFDLHYMMKKEVFYGNDVKNEPYPDSNASLPY